MRNGIRLGKIFDIEIRVDFSWLLIFAIITWSLAQHYLGVQQTWPAQLRWGVAVATSLLFFGSVLVHEMAHSLVSKAEGIPVPKITLFFFGGASQISEQPRRARDEFWMALVGPLASLALSILFGIIWFATQTTSSIINEMAGWLAGINGMLAVFNLLPGFPLDGGRVLRSIAWAITKSLRRATQIAVAAGVLVSWLMIAAGLWLVMDGDLANGLWIAFLGWFLQSAAVQEGQVTVVHDVLRGHTVRQVPLTQCPRVLKQLSLDVFVENVALVSGQRCFVIMDGDKLEGMVTMHRLQDVPRDKWKTTRVAQVMIPADKLIGARQDDELTEVLEKMGRADVNQLPVFDGDRFVGLVTRASIIVFLRAHAQDHAVQPTGLASKT